MDKQKILARKRGNVCIVKIVEQSWEVEINFAPNAEQKLNWMKR